MYDYICGNIDNNANVRVYENSILSGCVCTGGGILFSIIIDLKSLSKGINWQNTRRLIYGNLVAATSDNFDTSCFLLSVEDRSNISIDGTIHVRCQKELGDNKMMKTPIGTKLTLLETTAYFEAYRPILSALQSIKDDKIPLSSYLLGCKQDIALPAYFENNYTLDFTNIITNNVHIGDIRDISTWPTADQFGLDHSQYKALQQALTQCVGIIQGPPGTGKTHIGVKLTEIFYHNRENLLISKTIPSTGSKPILM
ncbi:unnamed protein product, partial [Didymodactylos carnosus]